jgi:hypothetical protein
MGSSVSRSTSRTSVGQHTSVLHFVQMPRPKLTPLGYLSKRQARAPLQIDVIRVDQGAQRLQRLAREEVCFRSLSCVSMMQVVVSA